MYSGDQRFGDREALPLIAKGKGICTYD